MSALPNQTHLEQEDAVGPGLRCEVSASANSFCVCMTVLCLYVDCVSVFLYVGCVFVPMLCVCV